MVATRGDQAQIMCVFLITGRRGMCSLWWLSELVIAFLALPASINTLFDAYGLPVQKQLIATTYRNQ